MPTPMRSRDAVAAMGDLRRRRGDGRSHGCRRGRRESPPEVLGEAILVISGRGRKMYRNLEPKPEGAIFPKRSKPQGERDSTPHDTGTSMEDQLVAVNIQGGGRVPHRG